MEQWCAYCHYIVKLAHAFNIYLCDVRLLDASQTGTLLIEFKVIAHKAHTTHPKGLEEGNCIHMVIRLTRPLQEQTCCTSFYSRASQRSLKSWNAISIYKTLNVTTM